MGRPRLRDTGDTPGGRRPSVFPSGAPPAQCPAGHYATPGLVTYGSQPCGCDRARGNGNRHMYATCLWPDGDGLACGETVYDPPCSASARPPLP